MIEGYCHACGQCAVYSVFVDGMDWSCYCRKCGYGAYYYSSQLDAMVAWSELRPTDEHRWVGGAL
jgi:hypothetical protein